MNEKGIEYLFTVYLHTQQNLKAGVDNNLIRKLIGISNTEHTVILAGLREHKYIREVNHLISISEEGLIYLQEYIKAHRMVVLELNNPVVIPPMSRMEFGYSFNYFVSEDGQIIKEGTIKVVLTHVLSLVWQLDHTKGAARSVDSVCLLFAVDHLKEAVRSGTLSSTEKVSLETSDQPRELPYGLTDFIDIQDAKFGILSPGISPVIRTMPDGKTASLSNSKPIAYERDLNWYHSTPNIPNQKLVFDTIDFIQKHYAKVITPLAFLNLLYKQYDDLTASLENPVSFVEQVRKLPVGDELVSLVLGFLLKWFGGYPINNLNPQYDTILKLVEREFFAMNPAQIIKDICKTDPAVRAKLDDLERHFNGNTSDDTSAPPEQPANTAIAASRNTGASAQSSTPDSNDENVSNSQDSRSPTSITQDAGPAAESTPINYRQFSDSNPVMGVTDLALAYGQTIDSMKAEKGQMIGVFGKWGRGKTYFLSQLKTFFRQSRESEYIEVDFHAWKYQETPASWAYLYEQLAECYLGKKYRIPYWWRLTKLNFRRMGVWPIVVFVLLFVVAFIGSAFAIERVFDVEKTWNWKTVAGAIPVSFVFSFTILQSLYKQYAPKAVDLIKKYGRRSSFKASLGIQADIQDELIKLLKVWIPATKPDASKTVRKDHKWKFWQRWIKVRKRERIVLFVEDIDRCSEDRIIQNIDALRVLLEDAEIAERLLIITAIDERILKNAILIKYDKVLSTGSKYEVLKTEDVFPLMSEYLDKLFISAIKLGELTTEQGKEYLLELFRLELPASNPVEVTPPPAATTATPSMEADASAVAGQTEQAETQPRAIPQPPVDNNSAAGIGLPTVESGSMSGITEMELNCFDILLDFWEDPTPRKMRILFYRYQFCRNLLIAKYKKIDRYNIWQYKAGISVMLELILHYSTGKNLVTIAGMREALRKSDNEQVPVPHLTREYIVSKYDIVYLFEVLEVVIAY